MAVLVNYCGCFEPDGIAGKINALSNRLRLAV